MRFTLPGPVGGLEALIEEPQPAPERFGVICHPHPLYGGTMDNKVVWTIARALEELGIATLRFNFRGVGASAGSYDEGNGETEDAAAVLDYGALHWPRARPVIAGFSFGAYVALKLALRAPPAHLITVAPPVDRFPVATLPPPNCPWLLVQGDADDVVEPRAVLAWAQGLSPQPQIVVLPGVGHFFHGALAQLREAVQDAVRSG
jgi:alpha/beta superfamily hydrolase